MQKAKLTLLAPSRPKKDKPKDTLASVWNDDWKYVPAGETDIAKRFRRIKREQALERAKTVRSIK
jgi:hypothetical protein